MHNDSKLEYMNSSQWINTATIFVVRTHIEVNKSKQHIRLIDRKSKA